jgi:hypothetical protein
LEPAAANEIWHRPDFQDRRDELITNAQAAALVKVHFVTLSSWKQRFTDFPRTVLTFTDKLDQMIHEGEFREWHEQYLATRGQRSRANYVAPTIRARSESELRTLLAELRAKRETLQGRLERLDTRIAKTEASLETQHVLGTVVELVSHVEPARRDQFVEAALDWAEQQWHAGAASLPSSAIDPVTTAFPPESPRPPTADPADPPQDAPVFESQVQAHLQR